MFDINTAINTAIAAAVEQAVKPLVERINALECDVGTLRTRIAVLENVVDGYSPTLAKPAEQVDAAAAVEALNSQEWFWEKVGRFVAENGNITVEDMHGFKQRLADAEDRLDKITTASDERVQEIVEQAINDHCETYDHDQYDDMVTVWGGESPDEFVKDDDLRGVVQDIMNDASFEVSVSL